MRTKEKERPKSKRQLEREAEDRARKEKHEEAILQRFMSDQVEVLKFIEDNIGSLIPDVIYYNNNTMVALQSMPLRIKKLFDLAILGKKASETDIIKENEELKKEIRSLKNRIERIKELVERA